MKQPAGGVGVLADRSSHVTANREPVRDRPSTPGHSGRLAYPAAMRIGLTGGIASGKSTVSTMLGEHGALVIDADAIAREVIAAGTPGLEQVVAAFGPAVLTETGELDRPAMGEIVFADEDRRRTLERIIHPLVRARSAELEAAAGPEALVVHDIPLLAETMADRTDGFDAVIVVDVPPEVQVERMVRDRGWSPAEAKSRLAAQATREQRLALATYVIDNTGTLDDLRRRVAEVVEELRTR